MAHITARLCRLLRDEVTEQLALKSEALTALAEDWRRLLLPEATDERFADGYAQTVTFGLLMAREGDYAGNQPSASCRRVEPDQLADWRGAPAAHRSLLGSDYLMGRTAHCGST